MYLSALCVTEVFPTEPKAATAVRVWRHFQLKCPEALKTPPVRVLMQLT